LFAAVCVAQVLELIGGRYVGHRRTSLKQIT